MLRNGHVRFGRRPAETHPAQAGQGAAGRPHTYVRVWAGWVYIAFILDVFSQRIVAWYAQTSTHVGLVMIPLWMALWERDREDHTVGPG